MNGTCTHTLKLTFLFLLLSDLESAECGGESPDGGRGGDDGAGGEREVVPDMMPAIEKHKLYVYSLQVDLMRSPFNVQGVPCCCAPTSKHKIRHLIVVLE